MKHEQKVILIMAAKILDYPDDELFEGRTDLDEFIRDEISALKTRRDILLSLKPLYEIPSLKELQELYVETFDYKDQTSLYLTAHELGDSRKRGNALIGLQKLIYENGFEYLGNDLADYIPLLLEFLAAAPPSDSVEKLARRLAYALQRIINHLPEDHPYYQGIELLMRYVFETPGAAEISLLEKEREQADLEELPYPLLYR
ncbi:nitrate reductase molybdenum cofactor assembly chaperone [Pseudoneobacillus sp. C159]